MVEKTHYQSNLNIEFKDIIYWALKKDGSSKSQRQLKTKPKEEEKKERYLLCYSCLNKIVSENSLTEIQGSVEHTFLNPAGIVFDIKCFKVAEGCLIAGERSTEWSWFSGFCWQSALCNQCLKHLGWFFSNEKDQNFFGLIKEKLV